MTAQSLIEARRMVLKSRGFDEVKEPAQSERLQGCSHSSMSHIEKAKEMIAQHSNRTFRMALVFDKLSTEERALVLIASGVNPQLCGNEFKSFNSHDRKAICRGVKLLDSVTRKFESKMGAIKLLSDSSIN